MKSVCSPFVFVLAILLVAGCGGGGAGPGGSAIRSVSGQVVDERGRPISGAEVSLLPEGRSHQDAAASTTTSVSGSFELTDVPAGAYTLSVEIDGPRGILVEVQVFVSVPAESDVGIDIRIDFSGPSSGLHLVDEDDNIGAIAGFVFDEENDFESGAEITATHLPSKDTLHVTTDGSGFFELEDLAPGPWRLNVRDGDLRSRPITLVVRKDTIIQTDIFLFEREDRPNDGPDKGKGKGHHKGKKNKKK